MEALPPQLTLDFEPSFSKKFMRDHAGQIISDAKTAITELIANAYDAGASAVNIDWPMESGGPFTIADDGTGMTTREFTSRWGVLSYDRLASQGNQVEFPPGVRRRKRTAFGRNGKGRHAPFYFDDEYTVATSKSGFRTSARVRLTEGGTKPFTVLDLAQDTASGHGTIISARCSASTLVIDDVRELIGARFLVDPEFSISLNGCGGPQKLDTKMVIA